MTFVHRALAIVALLVCTACQLSPAKRCEEDSDCGPGSTCDAARSVCVSAAGGGGGDGCACGPLEECRQDACEARYEGILISSPVGRLTTTAVAAVAELSLRPGFSSSPPSTLSYFVRAVDGGQLLSGTLPHTNGNRFEAQLVGLVEGSYTFTVSLADGGMSTSRAFIADDTGPAFVVSVPSRDAGAPLGATTFADPNGAYRDAHLRSGVVRVSVNSAATDVDPASVEVRLSGSDGGIAVFPVTPGSGCPGYCGTAYVKLYAVEMSAFRADFGLTAEGADDAGNRGTGASTVKVTRWRWAFDSANTIKGTPAVGSFGTVYFGNQLLNVGATIAISPSGRELWRTTVGQVTGSVAVSGVTDAGSEYVFVGAETASGAVIVALDGRDGGVTARCPSTGAYAGETVRSAIAATTSSVSGTAHETGVAFLGGNTGRVVAVRPTAATADQCLVLAGASPPIPTAVATSGTVVSGSNLYFAADDGTVTSYAFGTNVPRSGFPSNAGVLAYALAITGSEVAGGGGGLFPSQGGLFALSTSGQPNVSWRFPGTPVARVYGFAVDNAGTALLGAESTSSTGDLVAVRVADGGVLRSFQDAGVFRGAPALGSAGELVVASSIGVGELASYNAALLTKRWSVSDIPAVETSVVLDCPRDASGNVVSEVPGVGYVAASDGKLYSFVVDSRGVDTSAVWPKWQHDPRNTGNADTPLSQFACGP